MTPDISTARVYTDFQGFSTLRSAARDNSPAALREVATQFEALFIQMMLKSMRDAGLSDGIFDSDQEQLYQGLFDQQIAIDLASRQSFGIADLLTRQLGRASPGDSPEPIPATSQQDRVDYDRTGYLRDQEIDFKSTADFVDFVRPMAERAAGRLGTSTDVLIAQAALETGWGRRMIRDGQGRNSYNLFGIKSDARWDGPAVQVASLEYGNGRTGKKVSSFRVYESYQQSFDDYVDFIKHNPHYRQALSRGADAQAYITGLHRAGYATDPLYADKVVDIMQRITL